MKKRIFIAINLPSEIKKNIIEWQESNSHLNVRWTKEDNMHITMAFIGAVDDDVLQKTIDSMSHVANIFKPFPVTLEKIVIAPSAANPRMIWVQMLPNETLNQLNLWVDNSLVKNQIPYEDTHAFHPHITLARANNFELKGKKINANLNLAFIAESIDIMESKLKPNGAEYAILTKIKLNN